MTETHIYGDGEAASYAREVEQENQRLRSQLDDAQAAIYEIEQALNQGDIQKAKQILQMVSF